VTNPASRRTVTAAFNHQPPPTAIYSTSRYPAQPQRRPTQVTSAATVVPIRPVWWVALVLFVASIGVGVIYLADGRPKAAAAFFALAVVAVGLWLTSRPRPRKRS
jgi:hypothetical protein